MYQVASASDGPHILDVRNADVLAFASKISMAPSHGGLPKNLAELSFAIKLRFTVCSSCFGAFGTLAENLSSLSHKLPHTNQLNFQLSFENASSRADTLSHTASEQNFAQQFFWSSAPKI